MKRMPLVVTPQDHAAALNVVGTKVTVLASNAVTQGLEVTLQSGDAGTGPPPHSHDWDEAFYVLQGSVEFLHAGETTHCAAGTLVHLPAGTVHGFRYGPGGGQMLEFTGAGGTATQMFAALDREIPPGPPDVPRLLGLLKENGVTVET